MLAGRRGTSILVEVVNSRQVGGEPPYLSGWLTAGRLWAGTRARSHHSPGFVGAAIYNCSFLEDGTATIRSPWDPGSRFPTAVPVRLGSHASWVGAFIHKSTLPVNIPDFVSNNCSGLGFQLFSFRSSTLIG